MDASREALQAERASAQLGGHRLIFSSFLYCVHPQREAIIARTLAAESPPGH